MPSPKTAPVSCSLVLLLGIAPAVHAELVPASRDIAIQNSAFTTPSVVALPGRFAVVHSRKDYFNFRTVVVSVLDHRGRSLGRNSLSGDGGTNSDPEADNAGSGAIVVWHRTTPTSYSLVARRIDEQGQVASAEIEVRAPDVRHINRFAVAGRADGSWSVVWSEHDGTQTCVRLRRFSSTDIAQPAAELSCSAASTDVAVAVDASQTIAAWDEQKSKAEERTVIRGVRIAEAGGQPQAFELDGVVEGRIEPDLETRPGGFVISWLELVHPQQDDPRLAIFVQDLDAGAQPAGQPCKTAELDGLHRNTDLARAGGSALVAYDLDLESSEGWPPYHVGLVATPEDDCSPNTPSRSRATIGDQQDPSVAATDDGLVLMAWNERGVARRGTMARLFRLTDAPICGDANMDGTLSASDALTALQSAIRTAYCHIRICDVNGDGNVKAGDALAVLSKAVSLPVSLACPESGVTTTTTTSSTTSSTVIDECFDDEDCTHNEDRPYCAAYTCAQCSSEEHCPEGSSCSSPDDICGPSY